MGLSGRRCYRSDLMVQRSGPPPRRASRSAGYRQPRRAEITSGADFDGGPVAAVGPVEASSTNDGAVIRAGLVADVAERLGGHLVDEHIAYICAPPSCMTPPRSPVPTKCLK